jgi:hypothetical protein
MTRLTQTIFAHTVDLVLLGTFLSVCGLMGS